MGRGYSASRAGSKRPTLRLKRERSASMSAFHRGKETSKANAAAEREKSVNPNDVMKRKLSPQQSPTAGGQRGSRSQSARQALSVGGDRTSSGHPRKRSLSTLRMRIAELEEEVGSDFEPSEDERETVDKADVMTKYKTVGRIVDEVLDVLTAACVPGADTKTLCDLGDHEMTSRLKSVFSKAKDADGKRMPKGICYPTNVSVNEVLCNHSPFRADEAVTLEAQHVVKLHCGCHLDGYPVTAARTIVVPSTGSSPSSPPSKANNGGGSRARELTRSGSNAIEAARVALAGMVAMLHPGTVNAEVTDFIAAVGAAFGAEAVEGVLSNRVKRWVLDGVDCIIARRVVDTVPQQDVAECVIRPHQVWALDVAFTNCLSTDAHGGGEGENGNEEDGGAPTTAPRVLREVSADEGNAFRTTPTEEAVGLFRRTPMDFPNDARVEQANKVLKELTDKFGCFPFHFKALSNPLQAKLGINYLVKHEVVDRLSPLRIKNHRGGRRITARFAATVAVTGKRITVLCGAPPEQPIKDVPAAVQPAPLGGLLPDTVLDTLAQPLDFGSAAALKAAAEGQPKKKPRSEWYGGAQPSA